VTTETGVTRCPVVLPDVAEMPLRSCRRRVSGRKRMSKHGVATVVPLAMLAIAWSVDLSS